ncbi:hypothetical protein Tco_0639583 [Tanacetum coccineum]
MVGRGRLHRLTCAFWTSSVRPDHGRLLSHTALLFGCMACGLRGQRCSILLQFLADACWSMPSLVNTVALTGLLRLVGLPLSCLSLENTLAVCEFRCELSHDSDSENCVCEFRCELSP